MHETSPTLPGLGLLRAQVGRPLEPSRWFPVTQELIDQFSQSTLDNDPMHLDVEWSKQNTPFGGTVAAGFWTTSMLIPMSHDIGFIDAAAAQIGAVYALNYGFNRHRLITPVPIGSSVRAQMALTEVIERPDGNVLISIDVTVEIENHSQPALVAQWLALLVKHPKTA
jgi:acyl dehydratase